MSLPDPTDAITENDLIWSLPLSPRPERIPPELLATLSHAELLTYVFSLQDDIADLRITLQESLGLLADLTSKHDALRRAMRSRG